MPTFIGPSGGGGGNQIADALKNVMQQTSPLSLAHAGLYGASADKMRAEAAIMALKQSGLEQLRNNGILDPNSPSQLGAAVVNGLSEGLAQAERARAAKLYGARDPRTDAAVVGAGGAYTTTAGGQGFDIAGQNARNAETIRGADVNNQRDNTTRITTTGMQQTGENWRNTQTNETSRANNAATNRTSITTTGMQGDVSRANNADTISGEMAREKERLAAADALKRWEVDHQFQQTYSPDANNGAGGNVLISRGTLPNGSPAPLSKDDEVALILRRAQQSRQPQVPGVLGGGPVPSDIPPTPSFTPGYPTPTRSMQLPVAHDLTNTVDVPDVQAAPGLPSMAAGGPVVQPSLTPPPSMAPQPAQAAPGRSSMLDGNPEPADPAWQQATAYGSLAPGTQKIAGLDYTGPKTFVLYRPGQPPITASTADGVRGTVVRPDGSTGLVDLRKGWVGVDSTVAAGEARDNNTAQTIGGMEIPSTVPRGDGSYVGEAGNAAGVWSNVGRELSDLYGSTGLAPFLGWGQAFGETQAAKQNVEMLKNVAREFLQNGPYKGKWQKELDDTLLPSSGVVVDPKAQIMKVENLVAMARRDALKYQERIKTRTGVNMKDDQDGLQNALNFLKFVQEPPIAKAYNNRDVPVVANPSAAAAGQATPGGAPPGGQAPASDLHRRALQIIGD